MRYKREVRTKEEIRGIIEKHYPFVPINNRIFDDLYEKEKIGYRLILENENRYSDPIDTPGSEKVLHVHHRTYERRGKEYYTDLTVLCEGCYRLYHFQDTVETEQ